MSYIEDSNWWRQVWRNLDRDHDCWVRAAEIFNGHCNRGANPEIVAEDFAIMMSEVLNESEAS